MDCSTESQCNMKTAIFCCGNTSNGELGLRGIEDDHVNELTAVTQFSYSDIVQDISSGHNHTIVLLQNGQVFTCGNNDANQLARESSLRRLEQVEQLKAHTIHRIACGMQFSIVLNVAGQLFSWGDNRRGQLGRITGDETVGIPKIIKGLVMKQVIQVACGANHSLALTNDGELYSWGDNSFSQLGLENRNFGTEPQRVTALNGVPILQIAAGGNHSFALTLSGALFGWGKNEFGQLGLSDTSDRDLPSQQNTLRSQGVKYVCCGDNHTAVLTKDGGVFTFGAGMYGQLGHGSKNNELLPKKVTELMGINVTQVACGRCHTLAYIPSTKKLYSFGLGGSGQLCAGVSTANHYSPFLVSLPWTKSPSTNASNPAVKSNSELYIGSKNCDVEGNPKANYEKQTYSNDSLPTPMEIDDEDFNEESMPFSFPEERPTDMVQSACFGDEMKHNSFNIYKVICGGDHTFIIANSSTPSIVDPVESSLDYRILSCESRILTLENETLQKVMDIVPSDCVSHDLMSYIETTFSSSACLNGSFLKKDFNCSDNRHGVDIPSVTVGFDYLRRAENSSITNVVRYCLESELFPNLKPTTIIEGLRLYMLLPLCHLFQKPEENFKSIILPFVKAFLELQEDMAVIIGDWWAKLGGAHFKDLVTIFKNSVIFIIQNIVKEVPNEPRILNTCPEYLKRYMWSLLDMLRTLQNINSMSEVLLPYQDFYIPEITDVMDIKRDYLTWLYAPIDQKSTEIFFCDYPFIFDSRAKSHILHTDSIVQMKTAMDTAYRQTITSAFVPIVQPSNPYLGLLVTRDNIVLNTIEQLSQQPSSDLKKPLQVHFVGEDAVDAGGVKKEFFLLLIKEILDPKYGMFIEYPETRCIWFRCKTFEEDVMYYLIGIVCGLAIYNSIIIELPFPLALYKKLLKEETKLEDLKVLSPTIAQSLSSLLQYENDDVEDIFVLTFEISMEIFGDSVTFELKPGGKDIPVTKENREEYVNLYVDYMLNKSVKVPFEAFARGFYKVCTSRILKLFHAQELMTLVVGNEEYDWEEFEKNTEYKNGFHDDHPTIRMFWKVFHSLDLIDQKKFLLFLTGSDRIPILGMGSIKVIMQPMMVSDDHLPVAHTCFNILDLPMYSSEDILRTKLLQAIQYTQGFGLA